MKRSLCVFAILVIVLSLTSCSFSTHLLPKNTGGDTMIFESWKKYGSGSSDNEIENLKNNSISGIKPSKFYSCIKIKNCYNALSNKQERELYDKIDNIIYTIQSKTTPEGYYPIESIEIDKSSNFNEDTIKKVIYAFRNDNPEIFWLSNTFSYEISDNKTNINLFSSLPTNKCNNAVNELNSKINDIISNVPSGLSEYEREKYVYDYVVDNCKYNKDAIKNSGHWQAFTSYGALVEGSAVCEGYSRSIQLLLGYLGMECQLASGETNQTAHMWDVVKVNNNYYHLDATFDNTNQVKLYDYFNVPDTLIKKDHIIDPNCGKSNFNTYGQRVPNTNGQYNLNLPKCTSMEENYFTKEAIEISSLNPKVDDIAIDKIVSLAQNNAPSVAFKISGCLNYQDTIEKMFLKPPYKVFYYVNEANERLDPEHQIDSQKLIYLESSLQDAFMLELTYL